MGMLATFSTMSELDKELLKSLLDANSCTRVSTLLSLSADERAPLTEAITYGNIDFIRIVLQS